MYRYRTSQLNAKGYCGNRASPSLPSFMFLLWALTVCRFPNCMCQRWASKLLLKSANRKSANFGLILLSQFLQVCTCTSYLLVFAIFHHFLFFLLVPTVWYPHFLPARTGIGSKYWWENCQNWQEGSVGSKN